MTCPNESCNGTRYEGQWARCPGCGVTNWWDESRIAYDVAKLPPSYTEQGWCATRAGEDVGMGYGPTKATALADLRQRVRLAEGLDAAVGELRKLEKASGLDLSGWAPGVALAPEDYSPANLGCFESTTVWPCMLRRPGKRFQSFTIHEQDARDECWIQHQQVLRGLTAFMQWVGEPAYRKSRSPLETSCRCYACNGTGGRS